MDGTGHRILAPVFTACTGLVLTKFKVFDGLEQPLLSTSIMSLVSISSATWRDADLLALLPLPIATGTAKKRFSKKYNKELYYVTMSQDEFLKKYSSKSQREKKMYEVTKTKKVLVYYEKCRKPSPPMLVWSLVFRAMGIKKHRGWQSHSPFLWIPFWIAMTLLSGFVLPKLPSNIISLILILIGLSLFTAIYKVVKAKDRAVVIIGAVVSIPILLYLSPHIVSFIPMIVLALGLGDISHLIGDAFTQEGVPLFADNKFTRSLKKIPIIGKLFIIDFKPFAAKIGKYKIFKFARASNKFYPFVVLFIFICVTFAILDFQTFKDVFIGVNSFIWNAIKGVFNFIMNLLKA